MEISHPWHAHPLFLSDEEAKFGDRCSICRTRFDVDPFYACVDCKYYVHKSCAQLPVEFQHHFHPPHPLALCFGDDFACDYCHKRFRNELRFSCSKCDFDLDVKCALMLDIDTEAKEFITHFTHQHPLIICSKDGDNPLNCFACKKTSSDLIYGCTPCDYFLHKSCSEIPTHVLHAMHPQHALNLVVKFSRCNYCKRKDRTWKYYCKMHKFYLDVSCVDDSAKDAQNSERSCFLCGKQHLNSDSCVDLSYFINQSCIQLPEEIEHKFHSHKTLLLLGPKDFGCDSCHKWFVWQSHYGCSECDFRMDVKCALMPSVQYDLSDESIWPVIPPHFNHQHPLQLIKEVHDINCSVCDTIKVSPIYGCIRCEYFLHQSCLELPVQIEHPLHAGHVLTRQPLGDNLCQICCKKYVGMAFGCIQCPFFIGIECILELEPTVVLKYHPTVKHKYHCHPLFLIEKSYSDMCNSDNAFCRLSGESSEFKLTKSYSLRCIECDYNLHLLCGPLPCTIKDKNHLHALKLVDYIIEDDSEEYYCDICEEIRNPRLSVYSCEDCNFFAHVHCVISEIINLLKFFFETIELRIVGDLRFEDTTNPSHDNLSKEFLLDFLERWDEDDRMKLREYFPYGKLFQMKEDLREAEEQEDTTNPSHDNLSKEFLLDLLERLDEDDRMKLRVYFPYGKLFQMKEDQREAEEQKSSSEDDTRSFLEELCFYKDDIYKKNWERLKSLKPDTKYQIQFEECYKKVIEVDSYKVTSDFVPLFKALLLKYGDFGCHCRETKNVKSVVIYFLCRIVSDMRITYVEYVTEKQLITWICYWKGTCLIGFDLDFMLPFILRIIKSYSSLQAMKFENEAPSRMERDIEKVTKKIFDLENEKKELEFLRKNYWPCEITKKSSDMKLFSKAKQQKYERAGEGIV